MIAEPRSPVKYLNYMGLHEFSVQIRQGTGGTRTALALWPRIGGPQ